MANKYSINSLQSNSFSINTNSTKFVISSPQLQADGSTRGWLEVTKTLKITQDFDKSRVLLGLLKDHGTVVVKLGDKNSNLQHEVYIATALKKRKGFIKFLGNFTCNDAFTKYPSTTSNSSALCNGHGGTMYVIVMPHYHLGSLGDYNWNSTNVELLRTCIKQVLLIVSVNFIKLHLVHGDLHAKNILLEEQPNARQNTLKYTLNGTNVRTETKGINVVIMDFENSKIHPNNKDPMTIQQFYFDLSKFFALLPSFIQNIDSSTIAPILGQIGSYMATMSFNESYVMPLLDLVAGIKLT